MGLTEAQSMQLRMQRLLIQHDKEQQNELQNGISQITNLVGQGANFVLGRIQLANETREAKENAEVSRAMNIANSYMNSKISTDLKNRADYGEQTYRDELSSFDIYGIQTIQELNLSEGAKNKLNSAWAQNKTNILGAYEATLPSYQMTGLKNEIDKTASLFYNNDISTEIQEQLNEYTNFYNSVNPKNLPIQGENNVLLKDDHYNQIVYSGLANMLNNKRTQLDYNADTSLGEIITSEKQKLEGLVDNTDYNNFLIATEYKILQNLENDKDLQDKIKKIAKQREDHKVGQINANQQETLSQFETNTRSLLNNYALQNGKSYQIDFNTDENGNFTNDSLGLLSSIVKQVNTIDTLNLTLEQKEVEKANIINKSREILGDNLINSLFTVNSYEEAYSYIGSLDTSNELAKDLFLGTDIYDRANKILTFAKENNVDLKTQQGKDTLKYLYSEYGKYTDTDINKIYQVRKAFDILDKDDFTTYLRNKNLDANTQETLMKEYNVTQTKYAPQIKSFYNNWERQLTERLYSDKGYKKSLGLENKSSKLPTYLQNTLHDSFYRYLIEHGDELAYTDTKQLEKLTNELNDTLIDYLDKDAEKIFTGYYNDIKDLKLDDPSSFAFIRESQKNLIYSNGYNQVYDYLVKNDSAVKLEDIAKNKKLFLDDIAQNFYNAKDYNSLNRTQQIEAQGGFAYFGILETQRSDVNNSLEYLDRIRDKNGDMIPRYQVERVIFDDNLTPRYVLKDNSIDTENENIRNNVALILTPQSYLVEQKKWKVKNDNKNSYTNTSLDKVKKENITFDNFIISCALKDKDGNITWDSVSDGNFSKDSYPILQNFKTFNIARDYEVYKDNKEITSDIVRQQKELNLLVKNFATNHKIY